MSTCKGCGGTVGRDCFNPQECEWISNEQQRRANNHGSDQRITDLETALRAAQATIGELAMEVARLTVAPGCVARLTVALQAAQRGPVAEKAGDLSPVYSWLEKVARTGIAEVDNVSTELIPSRSTDERDIHRAFDKWHKKHLYADRENAARVWQAAAEYYGRAPAKPVEAPPTDVKPLAHGHRDDYYLMANARNIAGHSIAEINRMPNCVFARNLFGTGSTSAHQICIDAGIDPDGLKVERASTGKHGGESAS